MNIDLINEKISVKILLTFMLSVVLLVTGSLYAFYFKRINKQILIDEHKEQGRIYAKNLALNLRHDVLLNDKKALKESIRDILSERGVVFISIIDNTGMILADSIREEEKGLVVPPKVLEKSEEFKESLQFKYDGNDYIIAASPIVIDEAFIKKVKLMPNPEIEGKQGYVRIAFSIKHIDMKLNRSFKTIMFFVLLIVAGGIVFSMVFIKLIFKPVDSMINITSKLADGNFLEGTSENMLAEFNALSESINKISESFTLIIKEVFATVDEISGSIGAIKDTSSNLLQGAKDQSSSTNKVFVAITDLNDATKLIAKRLDSLLSSAGITSGSSENMSQSIEKISNNTSMLYESIDSSSSSIIEMTSSIKQIAKNTDDLSKLMAGTKESVVDLDESIQIVTKISKDAYSLSQQVKTNASDSGLRSIEQMSASMDKIKESVEHSTYTIKKLGETSNQIGEILTVIEGVTEQTDLLALNAAILAAQAGRHGKGFAVVADEIKALADRNTSSTKEIANIISDIKEDVENSIKAVTVGKDNVEEGVRQTGMVVKAFEHIYQSANSSLSKADEIKNYSVSQSEKVDTIRQSIETMVNMLFQVVKATKEQKTASELVMKMTEDISRIINNIREAINEQGGQSKKLSVAINDITDDLKDISNSVQEESNSVEKVILATNEVKEITSKNFEYDKEIINQVRKFNKLYEKLKQELNHFKIKNDK